ncbi:hypothetical protein NE865_05072 [Phthorimaea operculella]|nr:hypothetical protein NE865_05072 [Phthorimaea operculella]
MIAKFAVLLLASTCLAFPADEAPSQVPVQVIPPQEPQGIPPQQDVPQGSPLPFPEGQQPELPDGPLPPQGTPGGKPENADLKTDSSFWFRKSYYPVYHRRSYSYYPRAYYYSYPTYYSYWSPYSWW